MRSIIQAASGNLHSERLLRLGFVLSHSSNKGRWMNGARCGIGGARDLDYVRAYNNAQRSSAHRPPGRG